MKKLFLSTLLLLLTLSVYSQTYNVNTYYEELGGYVISVDETGMDGVVVSVKDNDSIVNFCEAYSAVRTASNYETTAQEFPNWRIPTMDELKLMYKIYKNGNGAKLSGNPYWSSTPTDKGMGVLGFFDKSTVFGAGPYATYNVRGVRDF
jgi:hypothetical protein